MRQILFLFLLFLTFMSSNVEACIIKTFYEPKTHYSEISWEPNKGDIPLNIDGAISIFDNNKAEIAMYLLEYEKSPYLEILHNENGILDISIYRVILEKDYSNKWHYKIQFDLKIKFDQFELYIYQYGLNKESSNKSSPFIGINLKGSLLFPVQRSNCDQ